MHTMDANGFSLGHAAIFLLGSASRQEPPLPIILRSGDVLIMSGKGRQSYHGKSQSHSPISSALIALSRICLRLLTRQAFRG
jgi:alkylated DNA repair dioxygenase AlkB